ncbi:thiamine phosphate synthase [Sphingomonas aracearum]|uniref:Thiamine phosphate synthase n=1 Tax=Sphingomonas aracearum TaxID=2283317 RepID=A0A369VTI6_9SPHN|nr:thiamine phosphate synthase [Sphingomonas aracearum]RDE04857.1 thiamine phosphate synthase [Sphingomonas aracearum]
MVRRHPVPHRWFLTDERAGDPRPVLRRLPAGTGVVFRHRATPPAERRVLLAEVRRIAARRGLVLTVAGESHGRRAGRLRQGHGWPAHNRVEVRRGAAAGAWVLFVSPVFATRSHPGARALGPARAAALAKRTHIPVVALGGMNARRFAALRGAGFHGWAAIDAFLQRPRF